MNQYQRARQLYEKGDHQSSVQHFRAWLLENPTDASAQHDLAAALFNIGDLAEAENAAKKALDINAELATTWALMATIQAARGQIGTPLQSMLAATRIEPDNLKYRSRLGTMLLDQNRLEHAIRVFEGVLKIEPKNIDAISGVAASMERQGRLEEALAYMEPHLADTESHAGLAIAWGTVCRRLGHFQRGVDVLLRMLSHKKRPIAQAMMLAELGALYDKMDEVDAAFSAYTEANLRRQGTWDPERLERWVDRTIATFSPELLAQAPKGMDDSERPILIVGMPRSGTSLVEQILSAHPNVHGAGELEDIRITSLFAESYGKQSFPECVPNIGQDLTNRLGSWYIERRKQNAPDCQWVTDKMPQNFQHIAWASLIMPGVRVIHCVRDPMDTMLSCYFQGFKAALAWSNRLEWLGHYYAQYQRLMAHWEAVCPTPIHTVHYETLVSQPEPTIKAMLAHCGIPFDPAVLRHHQSGRRIDTASYAQANQPIYTSSAGKAARYTTHLAPVRSILGAK